MIRSGLTSRSVVVVEPPATPSCPGENDSVTTSAQRDQVEHHLAAGVGGRVERQHALAGVQVLEAAASSPAPSAPSRKGASVRAVSIRCVDSTRTTVAP